MYRVLIVEDNEAEADSLKKCVERYGREHGERFDLRLARSAVEYVSSSEPYSLVFMDIDLPGINGLEAAVLMRLSDTVTPIIFVTNLAQYAVRGYEVNALDFIVKPVSYYDFSLRMDKAMRILRRQSTQRVMVRTQDGTRIIQTHEIVYVDILNHALTYHLDENERITVRGSLSSAELSLKGSSFVSISNSCIVNIDYIKTIAGMDLILTNGDTVTFSRTRKKGAMQTIADYLGNSV